MSRFNFSFFLYYPLIYKRIIKKERKKHNCQVFLS